MNDDRDPTTAGGRDTQRLFDMFPPSSYAEWRLAAEKTLKGVPFEKKLLTRTYEGFQLQPIYTADDTAALPNLDSLPGLPPFTRGTHALGYPLQPWQVAQELPYPRAAEVNQAALEDLARGLTVLHVPLDQATRQGLDPDQAAAEQVGQAGMSLASLADAATLLQGIALDQTPLLLATGANGVGVAALILVAAEQQGLPARELQGCIGMDPLGQLAATGRLPAALERSYDLLASLTAWASEFAPQLRTILVDVQPYHLGGASVVQDLAFALASGVEYLRALQARGLQIEQLAARMQFNFSIGASFFLEIARLRAARQLWSQVLAAFGAPPAAQKLYLHARTSGFTKTRTDAYNNMLRATAEAFAAVMGGCDSLHVSPFDEVLGLPDAFSRRIARNVQIILQEECNFVRLLDPAGGSWAVETLTDTIARDAWTLFQEIERQGGMAAALAAGFPQARVAAVRKERLNQVALRREVIIGTNMYANLKEHPLTPRSVDHAALQAERHSALAELRAGAQARAALEQLASASTPVPLMAAALAAVRAGATLGMLSQALFAGEAAQVEPLPAHRAAEQFETLRAASEQYAALHGARPAVFLANMGPLAQHKPRADFSTGFFEAGGFEVYNGEGFESVEAAAAAAHESGATIVVICSTDESYPQLVPALTGLLKAENPELTVILAGYPTEHIESFTAAGVDDFIHVRADCYATLARLQRLKGVTL